MVDDKSTSRYREDIVEVNGVKKKRIIVDGSTVVYKDIPKPGEKTEGEEETTEETGTPADPAAKSYTCKKCGEVFTDLDLYRKHNLTAHK